MSYVGHVGATDETWLRGHLHGPAAQVGGVLCLTAAEVEEKIGRKQLEREVRQRRFRMVQAGHQILIVCSPVPVRLLV
ncbi:hypothetical protein [Jannaschia seohaensis]|uniref:Uncharacterized protein n=1 Tax=Jannaschia seohaensis TaxID=475081 RepID=A0A2Y9BXR7_9RHOB|nr:hypothetical protein [Jannaschia seohaensis]PWJ20892.1 hypothetical protein BCF38_102138 [Jannaschia seohaensis]SSA41302.1 hypothetical protein SAMN05421539_102138 [Jannaschia seohaensis]